MILKKFSARDFRNINKCEIEFSPGVNLLHGNNAEGKTNVIEGIYLFSRGKSFRAREDSELVGFGKEGFSLSIEYSDSFGDGRLEYSLFGRERQRKKNGYKIGRVAEMIGSFRSVLFQPDNLSLVKGGPEERRSFLDVAISQCEPSYIKYYSDYKKALTERSCILKFLQKGMPVDRLELDSWSSIMADYASYVYLMRIEYLKKISLEAEKIMKEISSDRESLSFEYHSDIQTESNNREKIREEYKRILSSSLDREISAGVTLFGPHREDIKIYINGKEAKSFASQGQQRSVVLSMKLAEGAVIKEKFGEEPVYLFDDVLSELDEKRKKYLLSGSYGKQYIITSCDADECMGYADCIIDVRGGEYVSSYRK